MKKLRFISLAFAAILLVQEMIFPVDVMAISDPNRFMRQDAWGIDDECETPDTGEVDGLLDKVYILGDSITLGAKSIYESKFKEAGASEVKVVASGGGNLGSPGTAGDIISGYDALARDKDYIKQASTIIIAHGTNQMENNNANGGYDDGYVTRASDSISKAVKLVKDSGTNGKLYWVDVAITDAASSNYAIFSPLIDKAIYASASQGYDVLSWAKIVDPSYTPDSARAPPKQNSALMQPDGIHPNTAGATKLVDMVTKNTSGGTTEDNTSAETVSSDSASNTTCCADPNAARVALAGNNNVEKILNFYMRKGLSLAQASGIVGNMMQESGLKPNIVQGGRLIAPGEDYKMQNGVGFGLVQWTFTERQKPLQDHINKMGVKNTDLSGQLSFTWVELTGPYLSTLNNLKRAKDPVEAAVVVHDGYEKSNDSAGEVRSVRGGNAKKVYDKYKNAPALAGSTAGSAMNNPSGEEKVNEHGQAEIDTVASVDEDGEATGCSSSAAGGDFNSTLKAYAWPEFKGLDIKPTKAYGDAVRKSMGQGLYVGGISHKGIDCGGFVTLLVRDSGYEKGYNYNGKGGYTGIQEKWMKENWQSLGSSSSISAGKLQPGDVAINSTHTFIYVGDVPGFKAKIASASLDERAPMADNQQSPTQPGYNWYRKK